MSFCPRLGASGHFFADEVFRMGKLGTGIYSQTQCLGGGNCVLFSSAGGERVLLQGFKCLRLGKLCR